MSEAVTYADVPLRMGAPEDFARVRAALRAAGFTEEKVCPALRLTDIMNVGTARMETADLASVSEELGAYIKLFLLLEHVERAEVERAVAKETLDSFLALDLLRLGEFGSGPEYFTPVFLYPVTGLWIVSDRHTNPDGSEFEPPADVVFPAIFPGTLRFLKLILRTPGEAALDLCSGSGVGAIALSQYFTRTVAADLTERATHFARFNALLNGRENVQVARGDLYEAVAGQTFDRIIAHPPYMPALATTQIWRDGGATGEYLIRRIIGEAPARLQPGGTLCLVGIGIDTHEQSYEERVRDWLGAAQAEFDVIFGFGVEKTPQEVIRETAKRSGAVDPSPFAQMEQAFQEMGATRLIYGAIVLRRRTAEERGEPWTTRLFITPETDGKAFEWALAWRHLSAREDYHELLARARPRLSPYVQVNVTHQVSAGAFVPTEFILKTEKPFAAAIRFDGWVVPLAAEFNGQLTPPEVYEQARAAEAIPADFELSDLLQLLALLVARGFLVLDELPQV